MDLGSITSVAQTLFAALQCQELRGILSVLGYKSELDNLQMTVKTVKAVLMDAEIRDDEQFTHQAQLFIEELKEVVYEADDLLDEFVTLAERKHKKLFKDGAPDLPDKVSRFFSRIKDLPFAYKTYQEVKEIRKKLDDIADNHNKFGFKLDSRPICKPREDKYSYVFAEDIIGRDVDKDTIVGKLLDPKARQDNVLFLTIVGMGGMGKTSLAQLIYNDAMIQKEFPIRLWACVADDNPNHLNVNAVLGKILRSTSGNQSDQSSSDLGGQIRERLAGNKFLLFLDDIWNENRHDWLKLEGFLKGGLAGSWVLVTTRSKETAKIVRGGSLYELKGLSDEDSWRLFERVAFGQEGGGQTSPSDLVKIGRKIVKKCANLPLAIRVAGSLLIGQLKDTWSSFEKHGLSPEKNDILPILKFSYHYLDSPLKSCFAYCALFPKDHEINKKTLISLWMAQGYIEPLEFKDQSVEDAGEEYISILLRRCFFQDVKKDKFGEIKSFKLHDLMHDVAEEVSKKEICAIDCITSNLDEKIHHLSVIKNTGTVGFFTKSRVRTLLYLCQTEGLSLGTRLDHWMSLRALGFSRSSILSLPDQIGKLVHLRYLDLSWNQRMEVLPGTLTKLHNLETLILKGCSCLTELPRDFCKLVKLRHLDLEGCNCMTHLPADMGKLICLQKLTMFAVDLSNPGCGDMLEGLQTLRKIKGKLEINIKDSENDRYEKGSSIEGGYLKKKQHLLGSKLKFLRGGKEEGCEEALMEDLQQHSKLRRSWLPIWANFVKIELGDTSDGFEYLPPLGKLRHLRVLRLWILIKLEYIEEKAMGVEDSLFFPSLQVLELFELPRLKGWWREEDSNRQAQVSPSFPHLSRLVIKGCPKLALILTAANVEQVELADNNEKLRVRGADMEEKGGGFPSRNSSDYAANSKIRTVKTDNVRCVELLPSITELEIRKDEKVERLEQVRELWRSGCSSSLRILEIEGCYKLKSVVKGGLQHLTALEKLVICNCDNLTLTVEEEGEDNRGDDPSSCSPFLQSLRSLHLLSLLNMVNLPEWMQHLTSLTHLEILFCSWELKRRCSKSPPGQDWHYIHHIPKLVIY